MSARGLVVCVMVSSADVMVASDEGCRGGSVPDEEGSRRGVELVELRVEGGRTRFARRKEKNAGGRASAWGLSFWCQQS